MACGGLDRPGGARRPWFLCPSASPGSAIRAVVPWRRSSQGGRQGRRGASRWFATSYESAKKLPEPSCLQPSRGSRRSRRGPRARPTGVPVRRPLVDRTGAARVRLSLLDRADRSGSLLAQRTSDGAPVDPARHASGSVVRARHAGAPRAGRAPDASFIAGPLSGTRTGEPTMRTSGGATPTRARTPEGMRGRQTGQRDGQRGSRARTSRVGIASASPSAASPNRDLGQPARRDRHGGGSLRDRGVTGGDRNGASVSTGRLRGHRRGLLGRGLLATPEHEAGEGHRRAEPQERRASPSGPRTSGSRSATRPRAGLDSNASCASRSPARDGSAGSRAAGASARPVAAQVVQLRAQAEHPVTSSPVRRSPPLARRDAQPRRPPVRRVDLAES